MHIFINISHKNRKFGTWKCSTDNCLYKPPMVGIEKLFEATYIHLFPVNLINLPGLSWYKNIPTIIFCSGTFPPERSSFKNKGLGKTNNSSHWEVKISSSAFLIGSSWKWHQSISWVSPIKRHRIPCKSDYN